MKRRPQVRSAGQLVASLALISICMFSAPALAGFVGEARATGSAPVALGLKNDPTPTKIAEEAAAPTTIAAAQPKKAAPIPVVVAPARKTAAKAYTARPTARTTRTTRSTTTTTRTTTSSGSELSRARAILAGLISRYPILAGTTVSFGKTPGGYQAVAYYKSGRILISTSHTASLDRILKHEIWHIIDWRDNGRIDWGEAVPPK